MPIFSPGRNVLFVEIEKYAEGPWPFASLFEEQEVAMTACEGGFHFPVEAEGLLDWLDGLFSDVCE
jgi:hypothetical protein